MKTSRFHVPALLVVVLLLTGVSIYQNRVIAKQSSQIQWLMAHCSIRLSEPSAPQKK